MFSGFNCQEHLGARFYRLLLRSIWTEVSRHFAKLQSPWISERTELSTHEKLGFYPKSLMMM